MFFLVEDIVQYFFLGYVVLVLVQFSFDDKLIIYLYSFDSIFSRKIYVFDVVVR